MRTTLLSLMVAASIGTAACSSQTPASSEGAPSQPAQAPAAQPAGGGTPPAPGATPPAAAATAPSKAAPEAPPVPPPPTYKEVTLPEGATIPVKLLSSLASDTSKVEDPVRAEVRRDVERDGLVVVPAGTKVAGVVTTAQQSGKVKGVAHLAFRFTSLTIDDEEYNVGASSVSMAARSTKKKDATKVGVGAGAGALIGAIVGGGKGAAVGAGIGAGAGTGVVMATRGEEVRLPAGTPVTVTLTAPLTIRVLLPR